MTGDRWGGKDRRHRPADLSSSATGTSASARTLAAPYLSNSRLTSSREIFVSQWRIDEIEEVGTPRQPGRCHKAWLARHVDEVVVVPDPPAVNELLPALLRWTVESALAFTPRIVRSLELVHIQLSSILPHIGNLHADGNSAVRRVFGNLKNALNGKLLPDLEPLAGAVDLAATDNGSPEITGVELDVPQIPLPSRGLPPFPQHVLHAGQFGIFGISAADRVDVVGDIDGNPAGVLHVERQRDMNKGQPTIRARRPELRLQGKVHRSSGGLVHGRVRQADTGQECGGDHSGREPLGPRDPFPAVLPHEHDERPERPAPKRQEDQQIRRVLRLFEPHDEKETVRAQRDEHPEQDNRAGDPDLPSPQ